MRLQSEPRITGGVKTRSAPQRWAGGRDGVLNDAARAPGIALEAHCLCLCGSVKAAHTAAQPSCGERCVPGRKPVQPIDSRLTPIVSVKATLSCLTQI